MFNRNKEQLLLYPADGRLIPLSEVPDEAFASGMLGVGFAVEPTEGTLYAPMDGVVESVADARHAYTLVHRNGIALLLHVGIDSVTLKGEGFLSMVNEGDRVRAGDVLARVDLEILRAHQIPTHVIVLLTEPETVRDLQINTGKGLGGRSEAARYRLART